MLCAHFQGFCRDLYTEGAQRVALAVPLQFQAFVQRQALSDQKLSTGNPNLQTLTHDFHRLIGDARTPLGTDRESRVGSPPVKISDTILAIDQTAFIQ